MLGREGYTWPFPTVASVMPLARQGEEVDHAMAVLDRPQSDALDEYRRRDEYVDRVLRAASENTALIDMAREGCALAEQRGTDDWPTLEQLEQEFSVAG